MSHRILIADDDPEILLYYRQIFDPRNPLNVIIETFTGGASLVNRFRACYEANERIPLCILDMRMPGINGLQTGEALRTIDPDIILIIITGYADVSQDDVLGSLKDDVYYLQKPFEEQEIYILLNSLIKGWTRQQENKQLLEETQRALRDLKQTQEKLHASEQLYRSMLYTSPDGVCVTDLKGTVTYASQKLLSMFGFSNQEEIEGASIFDFLEPGYRRKAIKLVQEMLEGRYGGADEYIAIKKDGQKVYVESNAEVLRDGTGKPTNVFFIIRDITARKQIEHAEHEQRTLAEALRDTAAALNSTLNYDDLLDRILLNVGRVVPHDYANIMLIDKNGEARITRSRGYPASEIIRLEQDIHFSVKELFNFSIMMETGKALLVEDTYNEPRWIIKPGQEYLRSYVAAPIKIRGDVVGFLNLDSSTPNFFTPIHAERLQAFADQAALAIANARLFSEIKQYARETEAMHKVSAAISSSLDFDQVLKLVLEETSHVLTFDSASVLLIENDEIVIVAVRGFEKNAEIMDLRFKIHGAPHEIVLRERRPLIFSDVHENFAGYRKAPHNRIRSLLIIPLFVKNEIIGFLNLDSFEPDHFNPEDEYLAVSFATHVAIALENSRLYSETQRRFVEQSVLNEIIQSLSSKLELSEFLALVEKQIKRFIDVQFFLIAAYDEEHQVWEAIHVGGLSFDYVDRKHKLSDGLTGHIIQTGETLYLKNSSAIAMFLESAGRENIGPMPKSFMGTPLMVANKIIGAMITQHYGQENFYSEQDFSLFCTIGSQIAVAFENARLFAKMETLATTDTLTGIINRRHFFTLANIETERALRYNRDLALIMIDLDHFKRVNDTYGHLVGDQVLRNITRQCSLALRKIDIMGRYGGEEFTIILPETDLESAFSTAERLRQIIASTKTPTGQGAVGVTASLGVACLSNGSDLEKLLNMADQALYAAKQAGRNRVSVFEIDSIPPVS